MGPLDIKNFHQNLKVIGHVFILFMAPTITFISSISILVRFIKPVYFLWNKVETYCNGIVMFKPVGSLMCSKGFDTSYHDTGPFSSRGWLVGVIKFGVHICNTLQFVVISSIHTGKLMFLIQHQNNVLCRFYILRCFLYICERLNKFSYVFRWPIKNCSFYI